MSGIYHIMPFESDHGPGVVYQTESRFLPEDEVRAQEDLLNELHAKLHRSVDQKWLQAFTGPRCSGIQHMLALSMRWTSVWRDRYAWYRHRPMRLFARLGLLLGYCRPFPPDSPLPTFLLRACRSRMRG